MRLPGPSTVLQLPVTALIPCTVGLLDRLDELVRADAALGRLDRLTRAGVTARTGFVLEEAAGVTDVDRGQVLDEAAGVTSRTGQVLERATDRGRP